MVGRVTPAPDFLGRSPKLKGEAESLLAIAAAPSCTGLTAGRSVYCFKAFLHCTLHRVQFFVPRTLNANIPNSGGIPVSCT